MSTVANLFDVARNVENVQPVPSNAGGTEENSSPCGGPRTSATRNGAASAATEAERRRRGRTARIAFKRGLPAGWDYFTIRTVGWASASHHTTNWFAGVAEDVVIP